MAKLIIIGHGGYATGVKNNLSMIIGEMPDIHYIDFNIDDDIYVLKKKILDTISLCGNDEILFACDLAGGSPFNQVAILAAKNKRYAVVAGLNTGAYAEMAFMLERPLVELVDSALEVAHSSIIKYSMN